MIWRRVRPRSSQPEISAQVNFDDLITRDLNGFYPLSYHAKNISRGTLPDLSVNNGALVANYALDRFAGFLDGVNDDFRIAHSTLLNLGGTWSCWVKTDGLWGVDGTYNGPTGRGDAILFSKTTATGSVGSIHVTIGTTGYVGFSAKIGTATWACQASSASGISVVDNAWHHIACTFGTASGSKVIVYVDGVAGTEVTSTAAIGTTTEPLRIGSSADTFWEEYKGHISNVAIWSRVLSPKEIRELAENPWRLFRPANLAFYSFARTPSPKFKISADWQQDVLQTRYGTLPEGDTSSISGNFEAWNKLSDLLDRHKTGGKLYTNPVISTYSLVITTTTAFYGGVLSADNEIHMAPIFSTVGQKVSSAGVVSTYSVFATSYYGGVLTRNGFIHFIPGGASVGQAINPMGVVTTYSLVHATGNAYRGGVIAPNGDIHFVPGSALVGQKVNTSAVVSTYPLVYTTSFAYNGGVLAPNGDIHFVPGSAIVGQKISPSNVVSTYPLIHTTTDAYIGGVLDMNGEIHFIPCKASVGQKVSKTGVVSTYPLAYTTTDAYHGGVLAPNGDIHFVPFNAAVGQKINASGIMSTYALPLTTANAYRGGVLMQNDEIHFIASSASRGMKLHLNSGVPFDYGTCVSPFFNKF